jgi:acyl dehydratase
LTFIKSERRSNKMQFGRCFEEFEIGAVYKHWPGRTITEYDDTLFCMLTMNHHPLHIDANYAEKTQFKQRLVVGSLVFSIVLGMTVEDVSGKAIATLEFEHVKHLGPTFHGDTIYAETTVLDKKLSSSKPDCGIVTVETIAYNQRGENVLSFKRRVMVPTRAFDEAQRREWEENMAQLRKRGKEL